MMTKDQQKSSLKIFKQRIKTMKKKAETLSTLCNDVCLLCFGPNGDFASFPEDPSKVRLIIERYGEASRRTSKNKRFGKEKLNLSDVLGSKIRTLEKQLSDHELSDQLDFMAKESLVALSGCLESKIQAIDNRIELLNAQKNYQQQAVPGEEFLNGLSLPFGYQQFNGDQDSLWQ